MARASAQSMHGESCLTCVNRHAGWFCNLSPQALAEYDTLGMHVMVPSGGTLFHEGQTSRNVSILCSGKMKLTTASKEGRTLLVRIAKPGDVLGLSAAMSATPHETTAQAVEPVQVKSFEREDFLHFLERYAESAMHAAQMLNREYRDALSDATRVALSTSIAGRLARLLLDLADGKEAPQPRLTLALTHEQVAEMLGTTRESVTRALSELKRNNIIAVKGASLTILRKDALELLA